LEAEVEVKVEIEAKYGNSLPFSFLLFSFCG